MLSFCRSGLLALTLVSGYVANSEAQVQQRSSEAWRTDLSMQRLNDNSVLTEYFGEVEAQESQHTTFRVGFIPRFGCAPLLTFKFAKRFGVGAAPKVRPGSMDTLPVIIDGVSLPFPAVTDEDGLFYSTYMSAGLQRSLTSKIRIEVGNKLLVQFWKGRDLNFTLKGSSEAIATAERNCRRHDPSQ